MHNTSSGPPIPFASSARPARPVGAVASSGALAEGNPLGEWAYPASSGAAHPYRPEPASEPIVAYPQNRTMPARPRELVAAVALVALADVAFVRSLEIPEPLSIRGVTASLFFLAVPTIVVLAARARRVTTRLAIAGSLFLAIAARCALAPTLGTVLLGLLGVFALAVTLRSRRAFMTDVALSLGATLTTTPRRLWAAAVGARGALMGRPGTRSLAPIVVPLALVSVFVGIFGLANPLVGRWLSALSTLELPYVERMVAWVPIGVGAVLLLRPAVRPWSRAESAETDTLADRTSLNVAQNAMLALNTLFALYNALDAAYLWAGSPPPGVSERAYAHQGAAWLTLAIAALTVVVGVLFRGALAHDPRAKLGRALAFVWLGQGLVLALGTYRRLAIHITTSGLSNIRILGMMGTTLVVVGLIQVGMKLSGRRSFAWLLRRQLDALALGLLAFCLMPTHLISARINLRRVMEHEYQALVHVEEEVLEVESAAALLPMVDHDDERIRRGIAALLLDERDTLRAGQLRHGPYRDYATTHTLRRLEAASPKLEAVLGDVARVDAIRPFEYIRNSAIEGEIAQSEIAKVEPAVSRRDKPLRAWMDEARSKLDPTRDSISVTVPHSLAALADENQYNAVVTVTRGDSKREIELVVVRFEGTRDWMIRDVRELTPPSR